MCDLATLLSYLFKLPFYVTVFSYLLDLHVCTTFLVSGWGGCGGRLCFAAVAVAFPGSALAGALAGYLRGLLPLRVVGLGVYLGAPVPGP